nr:hypothetical protein BaRGS_011378 [Batillaria attramentaria]
MRVIHMRASVLLIVLVSTLIVSETEGWRPRHLMLNFMQFVRRVVNKVKNIPRIPGLPHGLGKRCVRLSCWCWCCRLSLSVETDAKGWWRKAVNTVKKVVKVVKDVVDFIRNTRPRTKREADRLSRLKQ